MQQCEGYQGCDSVPDFNAATMAKLAVADFQQGALQHAEVHAATALLLDPSQTLARLTRLRCLLRAGDVHAARDDLAVLAAEEQDVTQELDACNKLELQQRRWTSPLRSPCKVSTGFVMPFAARRQAMLMRARLLIGRHHSPSWQAQGLRASASQVRGPRSSRAVPGLSQGGKQVKGATLAPSAEGSNLSMINDMQAGSPRIAAHRPSSAHPAAADMVFHNSDAHNSDALMSADAAGAVVSADATQICSTAEAQHAASLPQVDSECSSLQPAGEAQVILHGGAADKEDGTRLSHSAVEVQPVLLQLSVIQVHQVSLHLEIRESHQVNLHLTVSSVNKEHIFSKMEQAGAALAKQRSLRFKRAAISHWREAVFMKQQEGYKVEKSLKMCRQRRLAAVLKAWRHPLQQQARVRSFCCMLGIVPTASLLEDFTYLADASPEECGFVNTLSQVAQQCRSKTLFYAWRHQTVRAVHSRLLQKQRQPSQMAQVAHDDKSVQEQQAPALEGQLYIVPAEAVDHTVAQQQQPCEGMVSEVSMAATHNEQPAVSPVVAAEFTSQPEDAELPLQRSTGKVDGEGQLDTMTAAAAGVQLPETAVLSLDMDMTGATKLVKTGPADHIDTDAAEHTSHLDAQPVVAATAPDGALSGSALAADMSWAAAEVTAPKLDGIKATSVTGPTAIPVLLKGIPDEKVVKVEKAAVAVDNAQQAQQGSTDQAQQAVGPNPIAVWLKEKDARMTVSAATDNSNVKVDGSEADAAVTALQTQPRPTASPPKAALQSQQSNIVQPTKQARRKAKQAAKKLIQAQALEPTSAEVGQAAARATSAQPDTTMAVAQGLHRQQPLRAPGRGSLQPLHCRKAAEKQPSKAEQAALQRQTEQAKLRELAQKEKARLANKSKPAAAAPAQLHQAAHATVGPSGHSKGPSKPAAQHLSHGASRKSRKPAPGAAAATEHGRHTGFKQAPAPAPASQPTPAADAAQATKHSIKTAVGEAHASMAAVEELLSSSGKPWQGRQDQEDLDLQRALALSLEEVEWKEVGRQGAVKAMPASQPHLQLPPASGVIMGAETASLSAWTGRQQLAALPSLKQQAAAANGFVGLTNPGNFCFENAVIQCLMAIPALRAYFISCQGECQLQGCISGPFAELVQLLHTSSGTPLDPHKFRSACGMMDDCWQNGNQQDAAEFLCSLLSTMQEEQNSVQVKPPYQQLQSTGTAAEQAEEAWRLGRNTSQSLVQDMFAGQAHSTVQCSVCRNGSDSFEDFMQVCLPLPAQTRQRLSCSVEECLRSYTEVEQLQFEPCNRYWCQHCEARVEATKRLTISRCPKVLMIQLKRFSSKGAQLSGSATCHKNLIPVRVPETLHMGLCMSRAAPANTLPVYKLFGVVRHGGNMHCGHYTAQCKSRVNDRWYHCSDATVTDLEDPCLSQSTQEIYLLFYELQQ